MQQANMHDVAEITLPLQRFTDIRTRIAYGSAASFSWSCPFGNATFYGYVHTVKPYLTEKSSGTRLVLVSAGFPLKQISQRVWTQTTASNVARLLATQYGLAYDVEEHPRVFPQIAQTTQSDWMLLRSLAERIGYSLRVEGVTLQFMSKATLERYYRALAPTAQISATDSSTPINRRDVLSFTPLVSEHQQESDHALANRHVLSIDSSGSPFAAVSSAPSNPGRGVATALYDQFLHETSRTPQEAQQISNDASERARYTIQATAEMYGYPDIAPNRSIYFTGLDNDLSGYWTVLAVQHNIQAGNAYRMHLTLGTEGLGEETMRPTNTGTSIPSAGLLKTPYATATLVDTGQVAGVAARWLPSR